MIRNCAFLVDHLGLILTGLPLALSFHNICDFCLPEQSCSHHVRNALIRRLPVRSSKLGVRGIGAGENLSENSGRDLGSEI